MRLKEVRISNFKSIANSGKFDVSDITCLVGKNESGKTALLQALYRLNPIVDIDGGFDATDHYPRRSVSDYEEHIANGGEPANVVSARYELSPEDQIRIHTRLGRHDLDPQQPFMDVKKGYTNKIKMRVSGLDIDNINTINDILQNELPKFLYFDEYYQMKGQENLDSLVQRMQSSTLQESDQPLLGLINLAGLNPEQVLNHNRTEQLIARLEAAENKLSATVLKHWSQNRHLRMNFDIRAARPGDGHGMTSGTNLWGRVKDTKHMVTTPLGTRSKGFVWFFSFLAWYSKLKKDGAKLILLLDEPGLSLHAKAQADLLKYFEAELKPSHQLLYTTHSPFMVDPSRFDRVRIVQDLSIDRDDDSDPEEGTRVSTDFLRATKDSLFPLQAAFGYEIHQTLFVGPNCLIVEGVSDLLYLQTVSAVLRDRGHPGLSPKWTITPVGGAAKVATFVALIGAQKALQVAVLVDSQGQRIENLYKRKLLERSRVLTFDKYTGQAKADIEDMFDPEVYLRIVRREFGIAIGLQELPMSKTTRIVVRLKEYCKEHCEDKPLPEGWHYRSARCFSEHAKTMDRDAELGDLSRFRAAFDDLNKMVDGE